MPAAARVFASTEHLTAIGVAAGVALLGLADGGASAQLIAALSIVLWWTVIVGIVTHLFPAADLPRQAVVAGTCLTLFGLLTALSLSWSNDAGRAFLEVVRVSAYLGLFIVVLLESPRAGARPWLIGLACGIVAVASVALLSRFLPSVFGAPDQGIANDLPQAEGRLSYPIGYWNGLAALVGLAVVLLGWLAGTLDTRRARAVATAALPICGLVLFMTDSRGGILAAALGVVVVLTLGRERPRVLCAVGIGLLGTLALALLADARPAFLDGVDTDAAQSEGALMGIATLICSLSAGAAMYGLDPRLRTARVATKTLWIGIAALVAAVAIAVAISDSTGFLDGDAGGSSAAGGPGLARAGASYRLDYWTAALDAFASDPVTGIGAGNFDLYWNAHPAQPLVARDAHSLFLESLAELGLAGLLLIAGFAIVTAIAGWRRRGGANGAEVVACLGVLAAGIVTATIDWTWEIPACFAPLIVVAALLTGPATAPARSPEARRARDRYGLGVAAIALAWASIWVAGVSLLTQVKLENSQEAVRSGDLEAAAQAAVDAGAVQPWSPEPPLQLAQVQALRGDLRAAADDAREAIDLAPGDFRVWLVAGHIAFDLGDQVGATADLRRARELSPRRLGSELVGIEPG